MFNLNKEHTMKDLLNTYKKQAVKRSDYFEPKIKTRKENMIHNKRVEEKEDKKPKLTDEQLADRYAMKFSR